MPATLRPRLGAAAYPALFVTGAVLGTFWDQLHVRAGTLFYRSPTIAGQPWWVPLEFGIAFVLGGVLFTMLGDPAPRKQSPRIAGIEAFWLTAIYAMTAFFDRWPWVLAGLLVLALAARAGPLAMVALASPIPVVAVLIAGPLTEAMLISAGLFEYRHIHTDPIPFWLPLLWANGIMFMARLCEAMLQRFGVRRVAEPAAAVVRPADPMEPGPELAEFDEP